MEYKVKMNPLTPISIPTPSSSPPNSSPTILTPCAACKILRRRCVDNCVLAPYFPPTDPFKFTIAHRVFGASNIIKFLQELPETHRADAVSSMVYEANTRIRDPVYGCAGAICQLQKQVTDLQEQLAKTQAELVNLHSQQTNLVALIRVSQFQDPSHDKAFHGQQFEIETSGLFEDDGCCSLSSAEWPESLWTVS